MSWTTVAVSGACVYFGLGFALLVWVMEGFRSAFWEAYREDRAAALLALVVVLAVWPYALVLGVVEHVRRSR